MGMASSHSVKLAWSKKYKDNKDKSFPFALKKTGGNCKTPDEGEKKKLTFTEYITRVRSYAMCFKCINSFSLYNDPLRIESSSIL